MRFPNATVSRLGWLQGLPMNETRAIAANAAYVWVGSTRGAARLDRATGSWTYAL